VAKTPASIRRKSVPFICEGCQSTSASMINLLGAIQLEGGDGQTGTDEKIAALFEKSAADVRIVPGAPSAT
jgi:hypothetical protein